MCDRPRRFDWCSLLVEGLRRGGAQGRWRVISRDSLGRYGHPLRNEALDLLAALDDRPDWVWSIDDDDLPMPGALASIREAVASGEADWYVFGMVGGGDSHFAGVVVPQPGLGLRLGNIGSPCLVAPVDAAARWGTDRVLALSGDEGPGYYGDWLFAVALKNELGDPAWIEATVAEIRPARIG
jgi:hypothetical protein